MNLSESWDKPPCCRILAPERPIPSLFAPHMPGKWAQQRPNQGATDASRLAKPPWPCREPARRCPGSAARRCGRSGRAGCGGAAPRILGSGRWPGRTARSSATGWPESPSPPPGPETCPKSRSARSGCLFPQPEGNEGNLWRQDMAGLAFHPVREPELSGNRSFGPFSRGTVRFHVNWRACQHGQSEHTPCDPQKTLLVFISRSPRRARCLGSPPGA